MAGICGAQTDALSLSLNSTAGTSSVSLNVVLSASAQSRPAAIQWTLDYPASSVLGLIAAVGPAGAAADKAIECSGNRCLLYGPQNANPIPNGVVAVLTFQLASVSSGQVAFQLSNVLAASAHADTLVLGTSNGAISVVVQPYVFPPAVAANLEIIGSAAQVALSGGWDTAMNLVNIGAGAADVRLSLFESDGGPLSAPLVVPHEAALPEGLFGASLDQTLAPRATLAVDATGLDSQPARIGSAKLFADGNVAGFVRFRFAPTGQEAALPLETHDANSYALAFDNTTGAATGVAVANLSATPGTIPVVIRDDSGIAIESASISLPANGQTAFSLSSQFPSTANRTGTIRFDTPGGRRISVLGMRFPSSGRFTTLPVARSGDPRIGSMAHVAVGGGWTTTIQLINLGEAGVQSHLHFFDDNGADLTIPVTYSGSSTTAASIDPVLPPNAILAIQSSAPDGSSVVTGSAYLTSDGPVTGFIRFSYGDQEAIVPIETRNAAYYMLAFDNTNDVATGVTITNVASADAEIPVAIRDAAGAPLGFATITIPAHGHRAFVLSDRFPETAGQRGTIEFTSPIGGQISVLGIRYPASGKYSTIPVLAP